MSSIPEHSRVCSFSGSCAPTWTAPERRRSRSRREGGCSGAASPPTCSRELADSAVKFLQMASDQTLPLSDRQRDILARVIEEYVATGQPVGSRYLVERAGLSVSASTVRSELAELEARGLLTHPHTSAGRVPTEEGYRLFAQGLLDRLEPRPLGLEIDLARAGNEVESALQATTEALAHVTRLLALVSAPPLEAATVRHVEVLALQPQLVVTVLITSTGGVTKRMFALGEPVDPGLVNWAAEYLNERTSGLPLGSHGLRQAFGDPGLSERERGFL